MFSHLFVPPTTLSEKNKARLRLDVGEISANFRETALKVLACIECAGQVWGAVLVCPGGEAYHAGERHGRAYVWPRVRRGSQWLAMAHGVGDPIVGNDEAG